MVLPNHEDLLRLKNFVEFVTANPTILNYPQLEFVKTFIEHFGGKVPEGEFQMPAGGKCPFGGDAGVKSETKPTEGEKEPNTEEAEMESDPESEVELDMEVGSYHDHDTSDEDFEMVRNAVFLTETKKILKKRIKSNTRKRHCSENEFNIDKNFSHSDNEEDVEEDPINTIDMDAVLIKNEIDNIDSDPEISNYENDDSKTNSTSESTSGDNVKCPKRKRVKNLLLRKAAEKGKGKRRTRSACRDIREFWEKANKSKRMKKPKAINCGNKCRHKCKNEIDKEQRQKLCNELWALDFISRKNYILRCIEMKKVGTIRKSQKPRKYTNHYFLKNAKGERKRVCQSFFLSTLCVGGHVVKSALVSTDGKGRYIGYDKRAHKLGPPVESSAIFDEISKQETEYKNLEIGVENESTKEVEVAVECSKETRRPQPVSRPSCNKGKKLKKDRVPQPVNCDEGCQMKCTNNFTDEQRVQICATFWTMDYKRRKDFVLSRLETRDVECITATEYRKTSRAIRSYSNRYFFRGARGENVRVCAKFFMATLCIGRQIIRNALENSDRQTGAYIGEDKRGRHRPGNKISDEMVDEVKRHIESYPTWVPHKNYKTRFLHSSLNIRRMYNEYKQICDAEERKYVGKAYFTNIFHKQYRLAFLKPSSKHDHKVSAIKRDPYTTSEISVAKKTNTNIAEFTGEEGGFWITPQTSNAPTVNVLHSQESVYINVNANRDVHDHTASSQTAYPLNYPTASNAASNYVQSHNSTLPSSNVSNSTYDTYSSVYHML